MSVMSWMLWARRRSDKSAGRYRSARTREREHEDVVELNLAALYDLPCLRHGGT